ncbi:MAG: dynamin family protein [Candidatus Brocadiae bacterium]|nr:dynamin family protein [Candidatus Brocadiia bacterium]
MESKQNLEHTFSQFNEAREMLAKQFYDLIGLIANHVFSGNLIPDAQNVLEEIHKQNNMAEAEKNVLKHLYFYSSHLQSSKFLLGVLGRFKSGKSTLLNAIAGEEISPMDTRISTGVLNFTFWQEKEECKVVFDSGQEMSIPVSEKAFYVDYRHNPDNEKGIHSVRHGSPYLKLQPEIIFVDTPGLEAVNRIHEEITLDFVAQCHAAIVVSCYPPFGSTELEFYQRIKSSIPNIFLVQNLPGDKLGDWIKLEAQTLENLHKMSFYSLDKEAYPQGDVRSILNRIADSQDESALLKFKEIHKIHLYSLNARDAYEYLVGGKKDSPDKQGKIEESRFAKFQKELYDFLTQHKGAELVRDYQKKGKVILQELTRMIEGRQSLLRKNLTEIEKEIKEKENQRQKALNMVEMLSDRSNLKMISSYKALKSQILDQDLQKLIEELDKSYGEWNIFRLNKGQIKEIKARVNEFNRLFGQRFQEWVKEVQKVILEARDQIMANLENHGIFGKLELSGSFSQVSMGEISGAGYIDYGFGLAFHGGIAYILGSIAGGSGIALLGAGFAPVLIGAAIGLGVSIPLAKKCAPALESAKEFLSKIIKRPANSIFQNFRNNVKEKLDEIERAVLDTAMDNFKREVTENINEYFKLFSQRMEELKNKKSHGMTQKDCELECENLQNIVLQLQKIGEALDSKQVAEKVTTNEKVEGLFQGVKGYLKKFTT